MSVPIIENWSEVRGVVRAVGRSTEVAGHHALEVDVDAVEPVGSFPNLLERVVGQRVTIFVRDRGTGDRLEPETRVRFRVRQAGLDRYFADPDSFERLTPE